MGLPTVLPAHAKLSASGSERWLNCPGSVMASEGMPPLPDSEWAEEGTKAHGLLELWLLWLRDKLGSFVIPKGYDADMVETVRVAVKHFMSLYRKEDHDLLIEERISLAHIHPDMFGTADVGLVEHFGTLYVGDYKHGAGYAVDAVRFKQVGSIQIRDLNTQLVYYALGLAHKYDYNFKDAIIEIVQPRAHHQDQTIIRNAHVTMKELMGWNDLFKRGVDRVYAKDPKFMSGPWCRWCPAKVTCTTLAKSAFEDAVVEFDDVQEGKIMLPEPKQMTPKQISKVLQSAELLQFWIDGVKDYAFYKLQNGGSVPGFKLVRGRGSRYWKDEAKAADFLEAVLGDEAFKSKLLSPAQAEKLVKNSKHLTKLVGFSKGSPCIAKASDKREELNTAESIAAEFEEGMVEDGKENKKTKVSKNTPRKAKR